MEPSNQGVTPHFFSVDIEPPRGLWFLTSTFPQQIFQGVSSVFPSDPWPNSAKAEQTLPASAFCLAGAFV